MNETLRKIQLLYMILSLHLNVQMKMTCLNREAL